jgi:hypothetical protein
VSQTKSVFQRKVNSLVDNQPILTYGVTLSKKGALLNGSAQTMLFTYPSFSCPFSSFSEAKGARGQI